MKILLFNHSGSANRGCEAIVRATVGIIDRALGKCEYLVYSYDAPGDAALGDLGNVEIRQLESRRLSAAERAVASAKIRLSHDESYAVEKAYSAFLHEASGCDLCLSVGGDTYCYGDNAVMRILTAAVVRRGGRVVLWGASIGENDMSPEKEKNLGVLNAVFAREPLTYEMLEKKSCAKKLCLFSDPAFTLQKEELPLPEGFVPGKTVGLNASPLVADINPKIGQAVQELAEHIIASTDMNVALVPHVTIEGNNDYEYLKAIAGRLNRPDRVVLLPDNLTAAQYKGYIARTRFFVGARTHATIAAYSSGVPTMVLGYSVKSKGIARSLFGSERFVFDVKNIRNSRGVIAEFERLIESEDDIRSLLSESVPRAVESAFSAGEELKGL